MQITHYVALTLCAVGLTLTGAGQTFAETPEEKGLAIAIEADKRDSGWSDTEAKMTMTLRNQRGDESVRILRIKALEVENDGDKSLTIFDEPLDVRGSAMLTFSHKTEPDDQWLYLPKVGRVKTIASKNKSGPFMGSEFAFEDLSSQEVEKYTYKYLKDEACGELTCFVVERDPVDEHSGYTRQLAWIDQTEYRVHKIEYYDRKNSLLKTLQASDFKIYLDKYWRPHRMHMENHQTGKSTELLWSSYQFKVGLKDSDFSKNSLTR